MKITRHTPTQLILEHRPIAAAVIVALFALMIALFGLAVPRTAGALKLTLYLMAGGFGLVAVMTVVRVQLVMDAQTQTARMSRKTWRGLEVADFPLGAVNTFRIDPFVNSKTPRYTHFDVTGGETAGSYVFCIWNPRSEKQATARINKINAWLGQHALAQTAAGVEDTPQGEMGADAAASNQTAGDGGQAPMIADDRIAFDVDDARAETGADTETHTGVETGGGGDALIGADTGTDDTASGDAASGSDAQGTASGAALVKAVPPQANPKET